MEDFVIYNILNERRSEASREVSRDVILAREVDREARASFAVTDSETS